MRYLKIFLLHFEHVFENRAQSLVWFSMSLSNPILQILFWRGTQGIGGWSYTALTSYYLLIAAAGAFLSSHIEGDVYEYDIKQGELVRYLIRPFPYYWIKLVEEAPYRILQGGFAIIVLACVAVWFGNYLSVPLTPLTLLFGLVSACFAYFLSFTYKMSLGLLAFWLKDIRGLYSFVEILGIVLTGFILPLSLYPHGLREVTLALPFAYMIYYPVLIFQGKLGLAEMLQAVGIQSLYLAVFVVIFTVLWKRGVRQFTAIGQ